MRNGKHLALAIAVFLSGSSTLWAQGHVAWVGSLGEAQQLASTRHRLILIHFWSQNCPPCLKLEQAVFSRPTVIRAISASYVPLKVNVTEDPALAARYDVKRWPTDVFVTADGTEIHRVVSPLDPNRYIAVLGQVSANAQVGTPIEGNASTPAAPRSVPGALTGRNTTFPLGEQDPAPQFQPSASDGPTSVATAIPNPYMPAPGNRAPGVPAVGDANPMVERAAPPQQAGQAQANQFAQSQGASNAPPNWAAGSSSTGPSSAASPAASLPLSPPVSPGMEVAMGGYCPVTLMDQEKWVRGDVKWGAEHHGRIYLFAGPEQQKRFLDGGFKRYAPALSGYDPVVYTERGEWVEGKPAHGVFFRDRVILFSDEAALRRFWTAPDQYVAAVQAEAEPTRYATRPENRIR